MLSKCRAIKLRGTDGPRLDQIPRPRWVKDHLVPRLHQDRLQSLCRFIAPCKWSRTLPQIVAAGVETFVFSLRHGQWDNLMYRTSNILFVWSGVSPRSLTSYIIILQTRFTALQCETACQVETNVALHCAGFLTGIQEMAFGTTNYYYSKSEKLMICIL